MRNLAQIVVNAPARYMLSLGLNMRFRGFALVSLGVVSCANPSVDGVPEDPGNIPNLPEPPAVHPSPTAGPGSGDSVDRGNETASPGRADAGASPSSSSTSSKDDGSEAQVITSGDEVSRDESGSAAATSAPVGYADAGVPAPAVDAGYEETSDSETLDAGGDAGDAAAEDADVR